MPEMQKSSQASEKLAISFWLWNYFYGIKEGDVFHDLEPRFAELCQRGFNAVRVDSGAGLIWDAEGRPRGEIALHEPFPGYCRNIRQMDFLPGGCRVDVLARVVELFELADRYDVSVILSSWFYLHTFWFVSRDIRDELFGLPNEERFMRFAADYDRLIGVLRERGLARRIAWVEIFNEMDAFQWLWRLNRNGMDAWEEIEIAHRLRGWHEEALAFLKVRHPDILFAVDTCSPDIARPEMLPRNVDVWNFHHYYSWGVYGDEYEKDLFHSAFDYRHADRHPLFGKWLRKPLPSFDRCADATPGFCEYEGSWPTRAWFYSNLAPEGIAEIDRRLAARLERDYDRVRERQERTIRHGVELRDWLLPGCMLAVGEGATYCASSLLRWEERSDAYWNLVANEARLLRDGCFLGFIARTNSGPEDPSWNECVEQYREVNRIFLDGE